MTPRPGEDDPTAAEPVDATPDALADDPGTGDPAAPAEVEEPADATVTAVVEVAEAPSGAEPEAPPADADELTESTDAATATARTAVPVAAPSSGRGCGVRDGGASGGAATTDAAATGAVGDAPVGDAPVGDAPVGDEAGSEADPEVVEDARPGRLAAMWPPRAPSSRKGWIAAAAAALVLVLAVGGLVWWRAGVLPDGVAYAVGDTEVTVEQLDREVETLRALYGLQPPTDEAGLAKFRRDLAQASAVGMIIDRGGAERGVVISDKVAQDTLTRYVEQFFGGGTGSRDQFVQALGTAGTSEREVLGEIKRQLLIRQLFGDVTGAVEASDEEVRAAFDKREADLGLPERRDLQNIVVADRAQADQIAVELARGADFALLASAQSADQSTKDQGGSLGPIAARQLEPGYAEAAFSATPGAVFGPVETRFGWNVGKVGAVLPPQPAVFEQVSEQLRQQVALEKATEVWRVWLTEQIENADVHYAEEYLPDDPTALPSETVPAGTPAPPR